MPKVKEEKISSNQMSELMGILKTRFEKNMNRHQKLEWSRIEVKIKSDPAKPHALRKMEETGGEPDVVDYDSDTDEYIFFDCSEESPKGRRSLCYDSDALESRKENKPKNSVLNMAAEIGIELLTESQYQYLQKVGKFDTKTSSWLKTPDAIRHLGGAIFGDFRFGRVFIYHNGAESYYAARGFRGSLRV